MEFDNLDEELIIPTDKTYSVTLKELDEAIEGIIDHEDNNRDGDVSHHTNTVYMYCIKKLQDQGEETFTSQQLIEMYTEMIHMHTINGMVRSGVFESVLNDLGEEEFNLTEKGKNYFKKEEEE